MGPDVRRRELSVATFCFQRYQSKATHRRHLELHQLRRSIVTIDHDGIPLIADRQMIDHCGYNKWRCGI